MKVLLVIDMQNDFVTGSLGSADASSIVEKVIHKVDRYNGKVLYTRDTHGENYLETQEGQNLPIKHCIIGTKGHAIIPEIIERFDVQEEDIINKESFGCKDIVTFLNKQCQETIEEVTLVGLCTDICVISNAMLLKAGMPECKIIVDASCCAGVTKESHANALEAMKMCQITVIGE